MALTIKQRDRLREISQTLRRTDTDDYEKAHVAADELLLEALDALGEPAADVSRAYRRLVELAENWPCA